MTIFDHLTTIFGVTFHTWSILSLGIMWLYITYKNQRLGIYAPVLATAGVTFSIHLYESLHGLGCLYSLGRVSSFLWIMNIPFTIILLLNFVLYNKKHSFLRPSTHYFLIFIIFIIFLSTSDFYTTLLFDWRWAGSKVACSLFVGSLLTNPNLK